jgi:hypothetical protein
LRDSSDTPLSQYAHTENPKLVYEKFLDMESPAGCDQQGGRIKGSEEHF